MPIRPLANLLYRHKRSHAIIGREDALRSWRSMSSAEPSAACRVGGIFEGLGCAVAVGSHAQHASRGYPEWRTRRGLQVHRGRGAGIGDITIVLQPSRTTFAAFPGRFLVRDGTAIQASRSATTTR